MQQQSKACRGDATSLRVKWNSCGADENDLAVVTIAAMLLGDFDQQSVGVL